MYNICIHMYASQDICQVACQTIFHIPDYMPGNMPGCKPDFMPYYIPGCMADYMPECQIIF